MELDLLIYIIIGIIGLALPWLKAVEKFRVINVPMIAILFGMFIFYLPLNLPQPDPIVYEKEILRLSEIAVIISLMGAGLKISRDFSLSGYRVPLLLVVVTMMGCIASTALLGWWFGLVPASALLLAAVFAPTDPVLAGEMQVELEEDEDEEHPVQFNLTAEAGINDGMAFPFTWMAIWIAMYGFDTGEWLSTWFLKDVLYRIVVGVVIGYLSGRLFAWLFFILPKRLDFKPLRLGFLAVAVTFAIYGLSEMVSAYGFIAVFVAALTIRHMEKKHSFNKEMHDVIRQVEQFLIAIILILLGGYVATHWFQNLSYGLIALCFIFILLIRPLFGIIPTLGTVMSWKQRWAVAFLGIKGVGSIFYLAYALHETGFAEVGLLWETVALLIVISAITHRIVGFYVKRKVL